MLYSFPYNKIRIYKSFRVLFMIIFQLFRLIIYKNIFLMSYNF